MMRLFRRENNMVKKSLALASVALSLCGCTSVDMELGEGVVPDIDRMELSTEEITDIKCYQWKADSVVTDSWTYPLLGSMVQQMDGLTECSVIAQYTPYSFSNANDLWGTNPVIDSIKFTMGTPTVYGDTLSTMHVSIYDLKEDLPYPKDSVCLSSFDVESRIGDLIHSFDMVPKEGADVVQYLPVSYGERLLDTTGNVYNVDTLFHKRVKPLYFKANTVTKGGALVAVDMNDCFITVYYHNDTDTLDAMFTFDNSSYTYNESFTVIRHDYSYADPLSGVNVDDIESKEVSKSFYITSLGGLTGKVEIDKAAIDRIKNEAQAKGYSYVTVNNANIVFPLSRMSISSFDYACQNLGLYYDYNKQQATPDYSLSLDGTTTTFDGALNRALEWYRMDVTSYVQNLLIGKSDKYVIDVTPSTETDSSPSGVQLKGSVDGGVKLTITYTYVK